MIYATLARYGATFLAGVFAMWLWHNAAINRIENNEAKAETAVVTTQLNTAINDGKQAGENSESYLNEYNAAKAENDALRERLRTGSVKLRVCEAVSTTAGIQSANSSAAKNEAEANLARYREDALHLSARGREIDAWVNSAHAWINR